MTLQAYEWKDKPALIEHIFPVQKISAEAYKEQMAVQSKTLTALGSYWKGRKPLILNKACVLGALLPITDNPLKDLEIFEMLMAMDQESLNYRLKVKNNKAANDFLKEHKVIGEGATYQEWLRNASRPEECPDELYDHIWDSVNKHLGTKANSFESLVHQLGVARFGDTPRVADVFSGSGQIPFEAARLGCNVYASDLNPIASMLTWGSFNIVGADEARVANIVKEQKLLVEKVQKEIDELGIEDDGNGWRAKAYLYCVEVVCPETGWKVPLLPTLIVSKSKLLVAKLIPNSDEKKYNIEIIRCTDVKDMESKSLGTVQSGDLVHSTDGLHEHRISLKSIRGDYKEGKTNKNALRLWEKQDFVPREDDIFQERLYCIQWMRKQPNSKKYDYAFKAVSEEDLKREKKVIEYVERHLAEWQERGFVSDMVIEKGKETERLYRERGWSYWHHLFSPRQILMLGIIHKYIKEAKSEQAALELFFARLLDWSTKLCRYGTGAARESIAQTFYNQTFNTFYNYGVRPFSFASTYLLETPYNFPISSKTTVQSHSAQEVNVENDIYITDPPYGDAVKYEEITEFFIAWLRKDPPEDFSNWIWDSRRSIAIKGEDEGFRQGMIAAYKQTAKMMPDNGIQVLMFTHQSGTIWADMASIIWASGLQVTAAWYVVTETDSALRQGSNVKGTVILVLRKRQKEMSTFRDDLGWEIESAVQSQVSSLMSLDEEVRSERQEGLYTDADLQMAGYAAALKVLTAYSKIDGKDMVLESAAPRQQDKKTFVDQMIDFAVQTAVQFLVPVGFDKSEWQRLSAVERFYLKMIEMEHQGANTLDNYQNFAKAFGIRSFDELLSDSSKANATRLKLGIEFKGAMMSGATEIADTPLRALLYAIYELSKEIEIDDVLTHLIDNCPSYFANKDILSKMAEYIAEKRENLKSTKSFKPDVEATSARVLSEAILNHRL